MCESRNSVVYWQVLIQLACIVPLNPLTLGRLQKTLFEASQAVVQTSAQKGYGLKDLVLRHKLIVKVVLDL